MIEFESSRMNFLQLGRSAFNYRLMMMIVVAWCGLFAAIYAGGMLRVALIKREGDAVQKRIDQLNKDKDRALAEFEMAGKETITVSAQEDLTAILMTRPAWSRVLRRLTRELPTQIWLHSVHAEQEKTGNAELKLVGAARSQRELTNFMTRLEASGAFDHTELIGMKKGEGLKGELSFEVKTRVVLSQLGGG